MASAQSVSFFVLLVMGVALRGNAESLKSRNLRVRAQCALNLAAHGRVIDPSSQTYEQNRGFSDITRSLSNYVSTQEIVPDLDEAIYRLRAGAHVVDFGAGKGVAAVDVARNSKGKLNITAISKGNPKPNELKNLQWFNEWFEKVSAKHITKKFGKAAIAYDYLGILSYTTEFSESIKKMSEIMKKDAWVYIHGHFTFSSEDFGQAVDLEKKSFRKNALDKLPAQSHLIRTAAVITKSGEVIGLFDWLGRQKGIRVERLMLEDSFAISFDGSPLEIDTLLAVDTYSRLNPPARLFVEQ